MKKASSGQIALMVVSMILGIMLAAQFKNVQQVGGNVSLQRTQELTTEIQKLQNDNDSLRSQIIDFERRIWEFENAAEDEGAINEAMVKELERTRMLAGLIDVEGPGVIVSVNVLSIRDWDDEVRIVRNVYYEDLLKIVNELNAAGTEALEINGERIISVTEIRNAGNFIVINTNPYSPPFEIKAIGNPDTLEASLKLLGGVAETLSDELEIRIKRENAITIAKYDGPFRYQIAQPVQ